MGLFSFIRRALGAGSQADTRNADAGTLSFDGDDETQIYVYIGSCFNGMPEQAEFYVDVLPYDVILHSQLTDAIHSSADFQSAALSYNGQVFGLTSSCLGILKEIAAAGFPCRLKVRKTGMYAEGIPDLTALGAKPWLIKRWWNEQSQSGDPIPFDIAELSRADERERVAKRYAKISARTGLRIDEDTPFAFFYPSRERWLCGDCPEESCRFSPSLKLIPPAAGSSAKPHVMISDGDRRLYEVSARTGKSYRTLIENIDKPCTGSVVVDYYGTGGDDVRIAIAFER